LVIKTLDWDLDSIQPKMLDLDPDPDPYQMNTDLPPWLKDAGMMMPSYGGQTCHLFFK